MSRDEILDKLQGVFQNVFDDDTVINYDTKPSDVDGWDSLAQIILLSSIQKLFGIDISIDEAVAIDSVSSIVDIIEKKLA